MLQLAPDVALVTYQAVEQKVSAKQPIRSLRSSIWKREFCLSI